MVNEIEDALKEAECTNDTREELVFVASQAKQHIHSWKSHLLRSTNQDDCRLDIIKELDETSVLLVLDWAMKYLPRKFRESQTDWYGKRGIPWHIAVAMRRGTGGEMEMMSFVHLFESCNQDSCAVLAILNDVFGQLKDIMPHLKSVYLRQDNAGCYHCALTLITARQVAELNDLCLSRMDFSDPQGGKGSCDRKAATIKSHMAVYLNSGHDIDTACQMQEAIKSFGGVSGVKVKLCSPPSSTIRKSVKWEGVSFISNIQYSQEGLRVWRAYNIGPGKFIPWRKFDVPDKQDVPSLVSSTFDSNSEVNFAPIKLRRVDKTIQLVEEQETIDEDADTSSNASLISAPQNLFLCPEEGCIKSYQRHSSLQKHLEYGEHKRALEYETLLDRAVLGYASRLEEGASMVPEVQETELSLVSSSPQPSGPSPPMGWALKHSHARSTRFSTKQKQYLIAKFQIGEQTGQKVDPTNVSRVMRTTKDSNGERLFDSTEFLTSQQIASFFSRLASKRSLNDVAETQSDEDEEQNEADRESQLQVLRNQVMSDISIQQLHPIVYDAHNICDLVKNSKLSTFSIKMLQDICSSFGLDVSKITIKRKKPYIDLLTNLVMGCKCQTNKQ